MDHNLVSNKHKFLNNPIIFISENNKMSNGINVIADIIISLSVIEVCPRVHLITDSCDEILMYKTIFLYFK